MFYPRLMSILFFLACAVLAADVTRADNSYLNAEDDETFERLMTGKGSRIYDSVDDNRHQFEVGTQISRIAYREPGAGMSSKGMAYGLFGVYNYRMPGEYLAARILNVYHLDLNFDFGQMEYTGSGRVDNIVDVIIEPRIWVGKDFVFAQDSRCTPYVGLGYRYLMDNFGGKITSTGHYGYDRRSQYLYIPAGIEWTLVPAYGWELKLNGEYDLFLHGWQTSYIHQVPTGTPGETYPDLDNDQTRGYGLRGSVDLIKKGDKMNYVVSPYVRYWNIRQSRVQTASNQFGTIEGYEPANTSLAIGARLGVQF